MSLVNRVSAFFLVALAICLVGYSATMYLLIREHLYHQFDGHLISALNVLVAALEVEEDGVTWQPSDHTITLGTEREQEEVRWIIVDEHGRVVDASANLSEATQSNSQLFEIARSTTDTLDHFEESQQWRLIQHRLQSPQPKKDAGRDLDEFGAVQVTVARQVQDLRADLFRLGLLACGLPVALWAIAAIAGRAYCRRALKPVGEMADRAHSMTNADFNLRLPLPKHRDELADLATSFNTLLGRLQQAYVQQQRFTGDAAHQLRTPLTVLRGEIDVALRRPRSELEYRKTLVQLSLETQRLQQIVESLLFLARTEGEMALPDQQRLQLAAWLPEYLNAWNDHVRRPDITLRVDGEPQLVSSPPLLSQALDNLLGNAIKYSTSGTPITITATAENGTVEIAVEDRGCGIPAAELNSVFDPFFRAVETRRSGVAGTGLGLAIVRQIALALGGDVRGESEFQKGSRFTLRFPTQMHASHTEPAV